MTCGHPKACWQATKPDSVDAVVGYRCVDCEREQLAVAAAIDKTEELFVKILRGELPAMAANNCDAVAQAIDAHDADTRNRALEEAFDQHRYREHDHSRMMGGYCTCGMFGQTRGQSHDSWALHVIDAEKREKRGGE